MNWRLILNIVLFQAGWFACLLLSGIYPVLITAIILCAHYTIVVPKTQRFPETVLLFKALVIGFLLEVFYLYFGILVKVGGESPLSLLPPVWLLLIWVLFATTFRHGLLWLKHKPWLSALFAAVAAPISYYSGAALNTAMDLGESTGVSLLVIAISWALVFPLLMLLIGSTKLEVETSKASNDS